MAALRFIRGSSLRRAVLEIAPAEIEAIRLVAVIDIGAGVALGRAGLLAGTEVGPAARAGLGTPSGDAVAGDMPSLARAVGVRGRATGGAVVALATDGAGRAIRRSGAEGLSLHAGRWPLGRGH